LEKPKCGDWAGPKLTHCAWRETLASPKNKEPLFYLMHSVARDATHGADANLMSERIGRSTDDVADPEPMKALTSWGNAKNLALLQLGATRCQNLGWSSRRLVGKATGTPVGGRPMEGFGMVTCWCRVFAEVLSVCLAVMAVVCAMLGTMMTKTPLMMGKVQADQQGGARVWPCGRTCFGAVTIGLEPKP